MSYSPRLLPGDKVEMENKVGKVLMTERDTGLATILLYDDEEIKEVPIESLVKYVDQKAIATRGLVSYIRMAAMRKITDEQNSDA
jgi:hypothetical protein